jgi:L-amino acid N-acyltransferase YncA
MDFFIRVVREEDTNSIVDLLNAIIEDGRYTVMDGPLTVDGQINFIRRFPKRGVFYVATGDDDQRILGLQSVEPWSTSARAFEHVGDISTFVALDWQGKGIGRKLSQATFEEARKRGFLKIMATVRADNPQAVSFYGSQGFKIVGTAHKHAFVRGRYIDEIFMEKIIE